MRTLTTTFLFSLLTFAGACASTSSGKCTNCDKAQAAVTGVAQSNPDCVRLTLHCGMGEGMHCCASTDTARIGTPSHPEDLQAVQTGEIVVLEENGGFDVTVPINNKDGKPTAACGVTVKPGIARDQAMAKAKGIAVAVEVALGGACDCCCK
ncbi:MAG: hypothetical protein JNL08_19280 [Planctomycetes bacterium]|nr:hypothetical protein [Planctomycetota bacterium]